MYIIFLVIKATVQWKNSSKGKAKGKLGRDLLLPLTIEIHKWLLTFIIIAMFIYVFKSIYTFMYRAGFPIFSLYILLVRFSLIAGILYTFALLQVSIPLIKRGCTFCRAKRYFHLLIAKRWKHVFLILIAQLLWIFVTIIGFKLVIEQLDAINGTGLINYHGKPFQVMFYTVQNVRQLLVNILLFPLGFLISNILYSPFVLLAKKAFDHFKFSLRNI